MLSQCVCHFYAMCTHVVFFNDVFAQSGEVSNVFRKARLLERAPDLGESAGSLSLKTAPIISGKAAELPKKALDFREGRRIAKKGAITFQRGGECSGMSAMGGGQSGQSPP